MKPHFISAVSLILLSCISLGVVLRSLKWNREVVLSNCSAKARGDIQPEALNVSHLLYTPLQVFIFFFFRLRMLGRQWSPNWLSSSYIDDRGVSGPWAQLCPWLRQIGHIRKEPYLILSRSKSLILLLECLVEGYRRNAIQIYA